MSSRWIGSLLGVSLLASLGVFGCSGSGTNAAQVSAQVTPDGGGSVCVSGALRCVSAQPQTCDPSGMWRDAGPVCSGATPICSDAQCVACATDSDCGTTSACATATCNAGSCESANAPLGKPCAEHGGVVCDGQGTCSASHCTDGIQDADESDTDCGGATCSACTTGEACAANTDCQSSDCLAAKCVSCGTSSSAQACCPNGNGVTIIEPGPGCAPQGTQWTSCDGRFGLIMQTDGNLVLYEGPCNGSACGKPLWASNTVGCGGCAAMQEDGNLVVYDAVGRAPGHACWASGTPGNAGAALMLQNDGTLRISKGATPVWSSGTCCH
ncbi:MAG TPA: hypothetical protein VNW92_09665 [Polyangiaceae bacterium]|nr:hypothetical protein [Polyangiaceae bacterium]